MKVGKPKSKRTPVRLRHKIEKASTAKQRKQRKEAKKNPQWRSRLKKDPGIPNLFPYKEMMLKEIEQTKIRKEEEQRRRREEAKSRREGIDTTAANTAEGDEDAELLDYEGLSGDDEKMEEDDTNAVNPMAALLASARQRAHDFTNADELDDDASDASSDPWADYEAKPSSVGQASKVDRTTGAASSQSHTAAFNSLLSSSDILLYILDARDPITTRSPQIEKQITADPSKRLFLILNKVDLIPPSALKPWLRHLRRSYPTLPILSTSSHLAGSGSDYTKSGLTPKHTTSALLHALKARPTSTSAGQDANASGMTVGVLGHPNVGKSTIINSLLSTTHQHANKRSKTAAPTGAQAGVTTALQSIKLDSKVRLLDAPGIVFPFDAPSNATTGPMPSRTQREADKAARLTLLNAVPSHSINDPIAAVDLLLSRAIPTSESATTLSRSLEETYNIPGGIHPSSSTSSTKQFLIAVARARGRLGKGGVPHLDAAARTVLGDWWAGRIRGGWVNPPEPDPDANGTALAKDEKKVVKGWAEEFKLDGLWGDDALLDDSRGEVVMQD